MSLITCRIAGVRPAGSEVRPRTTTLNARDGRCRCQWYIAIRGSTPSSVYCRTPPVTPITVIQGVSGVTSNPPVRIRLPTGSCPGQSCSAIR